MLIEIYVAIVDIARRYGNTCLKTPVEEKCLKGRDWVAQTWHLCQTKTDIYA
jgi:hypothetical protein